MANLPSKPPTITATEFLKRTMDKSIPERDKLAADLILQGNFPLYLHSFVPIKIVKDDNTLIYKVSPDFIRLGTDEDNIIWPLSGQQAQRIADTFKCILPTVKISNQIWQQAKVKLPAKPLSGMHSEIDGKKYSPENFLQSKHMTSNQGISFHNQIIQEQLAKTNYHPGDLVAGGKKDIVLSNDLYGSGKLGLHGLYDESGNPIQKGSLTPHPTNHIEYAVGIRLVDRNAFLNGGKVDLLNDILQSKGYAYLVNDSPEPLRFTSYKYSEKEFGDKQIAMDNNLSPISKYPSDKTTGAPKGFRPFGKSEEVPSDVKQMAKKILNLYIDRPFGTSIPFTSNGRNYMARVEPHSNKPRGITVYRSLSSDQISSKPSEMVAVKQKQELPKSVETPKQETDNSILAPISHYFDEATKALRSII